MIITKVNSDGSTYEIHYNPKSLQGFIDRAILMGVLGFVSLNLLILWCLRRIK